MTEYLPITTYSNWCEIDQLDGTALINGEQLSIVWPDGSNKVYTVLVDHKIGWGDRTKDIPVNEAFIIETVRGCDIKVRLAGTSILAKRVSKDEELPKIRQRKRQKSTIKN